MSLNFIKSIGPYDLKRQIGQGTFSSVFLATKMEPDGTEVELACKIVARDRLTSDIMEKRFENEIRIMQQLKHPGVVQIVDLCKDQHNFYVFMELCKGGTFFRFIINHCNPDGRVSEPEGKIFMLQILRVLQHVHSLGVCHRDLKPENILLDEFWHVKIGDFGLSRFVHKGALVETPCGSLVYASPECISKRPYDGKKSDVWSAGVILYAMLTGSFPWTKTNRAQLFDQIKRGEYNVPAYLSPPCQALIRGLMTVDVNERMTIEEALNHDWFCDPKIDCLPESPWVFVTPSLRTVDRFFGREVSVASIAKARKGLRRNTSSPKLSGEEIDELLWETEEEEDETDDHDVALMRQLNSHPATRVMSTALIKKTMDRLTT